MKRKFLRRLSNINMEQFQRMNPGVVSIKLVKNQEYKEPGKQKTKRK